MVRLTVLVIYIFMGTSVVGQVTNLLQLKESTGYKGELVEYTTNGENHSWIKSIYIAKSDGSERRIACRLNFDDGEGSEYWTFDVGTLHHDNRVITAALSNIVLDGVEGWAYIDDKASGTYTFSEKDMLETLKIKFHVHKDEMNVTISWKAPEEFIIGKTYTARIRASCSKTRDGGFMTYTYCALTFDVGMVTITEYSTDTRNYLDKRNILEGMYGYTERDGNISIYGFDTYGVLNIQKGKLVGQEKLSDTRFKEVIFQR